MKKYIFTLLFQFRICTYCRARCFSATCSSNRKCPPNTSGKRWTNWRSNFVVVIVVIGMEWSSFSLVHFCRWKRRDTILVYSAVFINLNWIPAFLINWPIEKWARKIENWWSISFRNCVKMLRRLKIIFRRIVASHHEACTIRISRGLKIT